MLAILLTAFCYLGWAPFALVLWFGTGSPTDPQAQARKLWLIGGASIVFGILVGVTATLTAANPPEGPGVSFVGNGVLAFLQLIFLSLVVGLVIVGIRQARWGFLILPLTLIGAFVLTWWGFSFVIPPQMPMMS
jgi:hypothetical protein